MPARTILAAVLLAASVSAIAKPSLAPVHPMSQKYSDRGAQPAKGRSGSAALEARALVGDSGATRVELTTGSFDAPSSPAVGTIEKVQVKVYAGGKLLRTDNYSKGLGLANAGFDYAGLGRGDQVELQANVKGVDGRRTDVVSFSTAVARRPDLEARDLSAPAQVSPGAIVPIVGTVAELNGDSGARFDCRLYVDGAKVGEILGAWIDAGSSVACQFTARFATAGTKQVVMRVTATSPADDDTGNNAVYRDVKVAVAPFEYSEAWFQGGCWDRGWWNQYTLWRFQGPEVTDQTAYSSGCYQNYGVYAYESGEYPYAGRVRLTHSMDGVPLVPLDIDVADVPGDPTYPNCRGGHFDTGDYVSVCTDGGYMQAFVMRQSGQPTYIGYGYLVLAAPIAVGGLYRAALEFESPDLQRRSALDVPIPGATHSSTNGWLPWSCTWGGDGYYYVTRDCNTRYWDETFYSARVYGQ